MKRLLVLLCACNQVYGLDQTKIAHDAAIIDEDLDGAPDERDNCVGLFNDQADEDSDGDGDACDNCPLFSNGDQQDIGDGDGVGDRCDPHPVGARDCLIVFDSFRDKDGFDQHWAQIGTGVVERRVDKDVDEIMLMSSTTERLLLVPRDAQGAMLSGELDVALVGRVDGPRNLHIASLFSPNGDGFSLGTDDDNLVITMAPAGSGGGTTGVLATSGKALANNLYLRLTMTNANGTPAMHVTAEHGILFGNAPSNRSGTNVGGPAIYTTDGPAVVTGFTVYKNVGTSATCPTPIRR